MFNDNISLLQQKTKIMTAIEFNTAIIAQQQGLKNFALSLTADRIEAQDLLQDTFMKALLNKEKFVQSTNIKAWLYMIMKNTFINAYRRSVKTRELMTRTKDVSSLGISKNNQRNTAICLIINIIFNAQRINWI